MCASLIVFILYNMGISRSRLCYKPNIMKNFQKSYCKLAYISFPFSFRVCMKKHWGQYRVHRYCWLKEFPTNYYILLSSRPILLFLSMYYCERFLTTHLLLYAVLLQRYPFITSFSSSSSTIKFKPAFR